MHRGAGAVRNWEADDDNAGDSPESEGSTGKSWMAQKW